MSPDIGRSGGTRSIVLAGIASILVWFILSLIEVYIPSFNDTVVGIPYFYDFLIGLIAVLVMIVGYAMLKMDLAEGINVILVAFGGFLFLIYFIAYWLGSLLLLYL